MMKARSPRRGAPLPEDGPTAPTSKPSKAGAHRPAASKVQAVAAAGRTASELIDERIAKLGGWRGEALSRMRRLIAQADPGVVEEWKWMGTPVWSDAGIICTGESYKAILKLTFAKGAALQDPAGLFNASLEGNTRRAIDVHEGEEVDAVAFKTLIRAAVALNAAGAKARAK